MKCRVCASASAHPIGVVEYYRGFSSTIYDCKNCRSRFTSHDKSIYSCLHTMPGSSYGTYREIEGKCAQLFARGDLEGLRKELCKGAKYRFVIESLDGMPRTSRLLEIGCAGGHLTSYFILAGFEIIGADVSLEAIQRAQAKFGPHFVHCNDCAIEKSAPFDAIYHVGTIGCISDPVQLTQQLLSLLRPGGHLLFNAPNAASCALGGQLWIDEAPPPDVVTLFRQGFWQSHFDDVAQVVESAQPLPASQSFAIALQNRFGRKWRSPTPLPIEESLNDFKGGRVVSQGSWSLLQRVAVGLARRTHAVRLARERPAPFGLHVRMTKRIVRCDSGPA